MEEGLVIVEPAGRFVKLLFRVRKVFAVEKSPYQEIVFAEIEGFGRSLLIDNYIQLSEKDEYFYHELLVHPAMAMHPNPERVLIIGGGDGVALREVLKHNSVKEAVLVDIDPVVVDFSRKYLEPINRGSFNDPRVRVVIMDGMEYIKKSRDRSFDVVIMDLTDPYAGEIAKHLYSAQAFSEVKRVLREGGVVATQAGSSYFYPAEYNYVLASVRANFRYVSEYWYWIPSFGLNVNFIVASDSYMLKEVVESMDEVLRKRGVSTRFINGRVLDGLLKIGVIYP